MTSGDSNKTTKDGRSRPLADIGINKKSVTDLILVWSGTIVGALAGIVAQMLIARSLGASDYGILSSALGLVTLAVPLCVFGTAQYWLKAFGGEGWGARRWFRPSLRFCLLSTTSTVLALALWGGFGPNNDRTQFVILALLPVIVSMVSIEIVGAKYQLEQRYAQFAVLGAVTSLARLSVAFGVFFVAINGDMLRFTAVGYAIASLIIFIFLAPQLRSLWFLKINLKGHAPEPRTEPLPDAAQAGAFLSQSWVFGVAGVLYLAWAQGHVVLANYTLGSHDAGFYSAALVILNAVCLLPTVAFSKFLLPKIHRWAAQDFEKLKTFSRVASASMLGFGLITAAALYFGAPLIIRLAFGPGFETAASVLQVLAFTVPMRFLGYNAGAMLRTQHFMRVKVTVLVLAVAFNLGLAAFLLPHWGVLGLAATVCITEFLLVSAYIYFVEARYFRQKYG